MIQFTTHNYKFFSRGEVWFYNGENFKKQMYLSFSAARLIPTGPVHDIHRYQSAILDILPTTDLLLGGMHPRLKYDLQLAAKKDMQFIITNTPTPQEIKDLVKYFNSFISSKPIAPLKEEWLLNTSKTGKLFISKIKHQANDVVFHIYLSDNGTILNTHSFYNTSFLKEDINKFANKFLHWQDILYFKANGYHTYSFGPINPELKGITSFKMNFGCRAEDNYRFIVTPSILFKLTRRIKRHA